VTILIASYNRLDFLKEAVHSALTQNYPDFEVLVIDDGSSEKTRSWLCHAESKNKQLRVIFQEHKGVAATRANGVKAASKDLILILDSDDRLLPGTLGKIAGEFELQPEIDLLYVNICHLLPNGKIWNRSYPSFKSNRMMTWVTLLFPRLPFKHSGTTYRRKTALELNTYDKSLPCKVDIDFFLKYMKNGKDLYLLKGQPMVLFRVHSQSLSRDRILGTKVWSLLIDRYGPKNPFLRFFIKIFKIGFELLKIVYVNVRKE